ncbi:hypothetical protein D3C81_1799470 [compost metagenome]
MLHFILRKKVAVHKIDSGLFCNCFSSAAAVTRQHNRHDPHFMKTLNSCFRLWTDMIAKRYDSGILFFALNNGYGISLLGELEKTFP